MKTQFPELLVLTIAGCLLSGCGDSRTSEHPSSEHPTAPASSAPGTAKATPTDLTSQFAAQASGQSDKVLGLVGSDLVGKVKSLGQSLGANPAVRPQVDSALKSLMGGRDSEALGAVYQVVQAANLTPQQMQLGKEVGNLFSAYVVQKNFASLEGAQSDVATIVTSLRRGEISATVPAFQRVAQNTHLTPPQKELLSTLADKYAPGIKKAADSLQQGLQGIKKLPGV